MSNTEKLRGKQILGAKKKHKKKYNEYQLVVEEFAVSGSPPLVLYICGSVCGTCPDNRQPLFWPLTISLSTPASCHQPKQQYNNVNVYGN